MYHIVCAQCAYESSYRSNPVGRECCQRCGKTVGETDVVSRSLPHLGSQPVEHACFEITR